MPPAPSPVALPYPRAFTVPSEASRWSTVKRKSRVGEVRRDVDAHVLHRAEEQIAIVVDVHGAKVVAGARPREIAARQRGRWSQDRRAGELSDLTYSPLRACGSPAGGAVRPCSVTIDVNGSSVAADEVGVSAALPLALIGSVAKTLPNACVTRARRYKTAPVSTSTNTRQCSAFQGPSAVVNRTSLTT